jgi:hypothetical protein
MSVFFLCAQCAALAQQPPTVTIKAYQRNQPDGSARYEYRVINRGTKRIVGFAIGSDYYHSASELTVPPTGWTFDTGLADGSTTSPHSWHATLITTEESQYVELEWRNNGAADIMPGQTATGFSVVTVVPNQHYLSGNWTAFFSDSTIESARLLRDDNPDR